MLLIAFDFPFDQQLKGVARQSCCCFQGVLLKQTGWRLDHSCQFRSHSCQVIKNVLEVQGMEVGEQTLEAEAEREAEAAWAPGGPVKPMAGAPRHH